MSPYTLLLVEDSEFITQHVSQTLESKHGFEIETVPTATGTRDALEDGSFDCVISSYELPDETGIDLAASINGRTGSPAVPFILFTGNPLESLAEEALTSGVSAFVSKSSHATGDMNVFANRIRLTIQAHE
ncbi:response regulator [Natrarchaeobius halalkaliphilus]|uniref:Response regulator n=1 Tax=Natrarchaeobius halalkaliphilus TaxID=1679091 RepID=A0A3N6P3T6_9EURY|nr:response regulator [Natrarchaeobius halalkaliphilus]RQG90005.1 response regulator [Natrarchaeobius halalkaliphilus]